MFHLGFSYIGFLFLLMLFVPNLIWTKNKPEGYETYVLREKKILQIFERIGEVLVCIIVLSFSDFNPRKSYWAVWLFMSLILMLIYEMYWVRYFKSPHTMSDFYCSFCKIPLAGATLPVAACICLGIYGSNIFLMIATIILAIGHIGIHNNHRKEICRTTPKKNKIVRILKGVAVAVVTIVIVITTVVIGGRNIHYLRHYCGFHGVDEDTCISIGGQQQRVIIRGENIENPVIVYLHGGPASPDSYITYKFSDHLVNEYTFVAWDQRGCGSTYMKNESVDPENGTATYTQALEDLDALVDYVRERFDKDKVIIMGWSYGTLVGSDYVSRHPEKVDAYIGIGQFVSIYDSDIFSYEDALDKAIAAGDDTADMTVAFEAFLADRSLENTMKLRQYTTPYHPQEIVGNTTLYALFSPYFTMDDFRWFIKQMGSMDDYYALNRQLYDYTFEADVRDLGTEYQVPMYYISGSCDWTCSAIKAEEYVNEITAPDKEMVVLEGCGHGVQYDLPEEFAQQVKRLLGRTE